MPADSLRRALRVSTSPLHKELDTVVGDFATAPDYASYLRRTHRFRTCIERALGNDRASGWRIEPVADLVRQDLADLGESPLPDADDPQWRLSPAARMGAAYVVEGSSLGARLLLQRAKALGLREDFGARHLAHQAADVQRWRTFLAGLETLPEDMHAAALGAARDTFRLALSIYSETADEFA